MRYEPKSSLQDINDYGHFLNRGAWMTASGYGRKFLSDLQHCESCLAEAEREIAALRSFVKDIATNYDHEECYHRNGLADTCCRQCKAEQLLNSEGRAGA